MVNIGIIGSGTMARVHAERLASMEGATVTAVSSPNTAEAFVAEHAPGATAYADPAALCGADDVDAVDVCSPTHRHREHVELAAAHGLDVLCEKPLARTAEEAAEIARIVDDAGIICMVAHVTRFFDEYAAARERVEAGDVGEVGVATARRAVGFGGERGWFGDDEKSGGVLLDLAIHDFDYLRWTVGEVERVFTRLAEWGPGNESQAAITLLRFENGAVGHVETEWMRLGGLPFSASFEFAGDAGLLEYDNQEVRPIQHFGPEGSHVPVDPVGDAIPLAVDGYRRELEHFVDCVRERSDPLVTVADGAAAMHISLAAIESAKRGAPVSPTEVAR